MLSRPPVRSLLVAMRIQPIVPSEYAEFHPTSRDFSKVYELATTGQKGEFDIRDGLLYKGQLLCVPEDGDRLMWLREAHTSRVAGHFGMNKTLLNLRRYVFWPKMQDDVTKYCRGCKLCCTSKPSNRKMGLYLPLPVPTRPWESIVWPPLWGPLESVRPVHLVLVRPNQSKSTRPNPSASTLPNLHGP